MRDYKPMIANEVYTDALFHSRSLAYCTGFLDGYNGHEACGFSTDLDKLLYKVGYEAGVTEYCNKHHPEE